MKREVLKKVSKRREPLRLDPTSLALNKPGVNASLASVSVFGGPVRGVGRPPQLPFSTTGASLYDEPVHCRQLYRLRLAGLTDARIADVLGIALRTFMYWKTEHEAFRRAYDDGGAHADSLVAKSLFQRAIGYEQHIEKVFYNSREDKIVKTKVKDKFAPDTAAAIFWLTNRMNASWKNKSSTEHTGANGEPLKPPTIIINPVMAATAIAPMISGKVMDVEDEHSP